MRHAVIENGKVVNLVIADASFAAQQGWVAIEDHIDITWLFDGQNFTAPPRDIESEAAKVRAKRDALLLESDTEVMPDRWMVMEEEEKLAWATYREALRDVPQQAGFPNEIEWPVAPDA